MAKLRSELSIIDIIVLIVAGLFVLTGWWVAPVVVFYFIVKKINNKNLKILCYIAIALQVFSILVSFYDSFMYDWFWDLTNISQILGVSNVHLFISSINYGFQFVVYVIITISYIVSAEKNKVVSGILVFNTITWLIVAFSSILVVLIPSSYNNFRFFNKLFTATQFEDYLMGIVLVLLYKDTFFHLKDEEIYETYEETI